MKRIFLFFAYLIAAVSLAAQTNEPVKMAIVAESPDASGVCDILTAQLSANDKVRLLERDEIEKVYHEQGMSVENRDDVKMGRLLGADGLLMLDVEILTETNPIYGLPQQVTNLTTRLIAVKPGVILSDEKFSTGDFITWSSEYANYLSTFLPKLTMDPGSAIPISVVNLRSAISSEQDVEAEKALKSLTIQRLSQEQRFFVLERERMQEMEREKGFNADESAFWDGSYLLEGTVDPNGYSSDVITVDIRLIPPKGGAPLSFQVLGARTNLAEVINQMADKIAGLLRVQSDVPAWSAAEEASRFFAEAKWAMKWGEYPEAEAAADSAWALGKQDLECALVRVQSYNLDLSTHIEAIVNGENSYTPGFDAQGKPVGPPPTEADILLNITNILADHPWGVTYKEAYPAPSVTSVRYAFVDSPPSAENVDRAIHALELYYNFSRNSPDGQPKVLWHGPGWEDWHDSDWYKLGINNLVAASRVLQNFNLSLESQNANADKLAELRSLARSVATLISESPSVHDSYFVGDRPLTYDEPATTMEDQPNIFRCEVTWGCYWQERPEDALSLYRELMASPVFSYIHCDFWLRAVQSPRLIAWDENDQKRIPVVWNHFMDELDGSSSAFLRLENRALLLADANNEAETATAFTNLMNGVLENSDAFVTNNVEVLNLNWGLNALVQAMMRETVVTEIYSSDQSALGMTVNYGIVGPITESLRNLYHSYYEPKLKAIDQEFLQQLGFEQQKAYLENNTPYDDMKFTELFEPVHLSNNQAEQILPLVIAYKSNLISQCLGVIGLQQQIRHYSDARSIMQLIGTNVMHLRPAAIQQAFKFEDTIGDINFLEDDVRKIVNTTSPSAAPAPENQPKTIVKSAPPLAPKPIPTQEPISIPRETITNVTIVDTFIPIPMENLFQLQSYEHLDSSNVTITTHQVVDEKLLFDLHYTANVVSEVAYGRNLDGSAVALFDPATRKWMVIDCPQGDLGSQNNFYYRTTLLNGELFHSDAGKIWKYDRASGQWQPLVISDGNNYELFAVGGHLYAANESVIFEITPDGSATHILASVRRQPPMSLLDTAGLGTPILFEGPDHSLRVCTDKKIYTWTGYDWRPDFDRLSSPYQPEIFPGGVLFRSETEFSFLAANTNTTQLYLWQKRVNPQILGFNPNNNSTPTTDPRWKIPADLNLYEGSVSIEPDRQLILFDHSAIREIANDQQMLTQEKIVPKDGYDAELLNFSSDLLLPEHLFLQFVSPDGCPPLSGGETASPAFGQPPPHWMAFLANKLFFGLEMRRDGVPFSGSDRLGVGYQPGIWLLPWSEIQSGITAQEQEQLAQMAQDKAAAEKTRADILAKYDLNHNGVIDPEEKEAALKDSAFIAAELDTIDANQNGILDPEELAYFDVYHRKYPSAVEKAAIETTEHLLAQKLMKKFDANGGGILQQDEFRSLIQDIDSTDSPYWQMLYYGYKNTDQCIDVEGITAYLKRQTVKEIAGSGIPQASFYIPVQTMSRIPDNFFEDAVDDYWQNLK